ncbi:hypothetical protein [Chryseobacterium sp.]|uniref:hypothetical protein n=1 Tax=Chryseobacterium sp. TaxID=1871047 RepID=UPI002353247E|nr:hypothetical protein [Chryseobacterium sp.]
MKKNLVYGLLLLCTLSVSLNSCRTDEMLTSTEQTQKEKIAFFERFEKEKSLSKNAGSSNYALPFGNSMLAYFEKYPEKKTELENKYGTVDLKVSSQDIGGDKGDDRKLLFFPMLKDGKVTAVIAGVINAERDYLYFDVHQNTNSDVIYLINKFQHYYDTKTVSRNSNNPIDVGEVIIIVTRPVKLTMSDVWSGTGGFGNPGHDMGGGNGDFGGNGGSGGNPYTPQNQNPCEQTKNIVNNSKSKPAIDSLKSKASKGGEDGYKIKADGTPSDLIPGGTHSVNFGDKTGYQGGYHNHTPTGIPMLSPPDIDQLLQFALAQGNGNSTNASNAFIGMVAPNGMHYVATFNGSYNDALVTFSQQQIDNYVSDYQILKNDLTSSLLYGNTYINSDGSINNLGVEKLFFDTLKNMGLDGKVNLQRVESNGNGNTVKSIKLDSNNKPTPTTC